MILRIFRALARTGQEEVYAQFLRTTTVPFLKRQAGCLEVRIGRHFTGEGEVEFLVVSVWDSLDHLKASTGANWTQPVVDPEEAPLLASSECDHFEEVPL